MAWLLLVGAGLFEIGFTTCMKMKQETGNYWWDAAFFVCAIISFGLLSAAIKTIPLGTAYAVWTGIGAVGTAVIGMVFFKDPASFWRLFFLFTIIASIVGLKLVSSH